MTTDAEKRWEEELHRRVETGGGIGVHERKLEQLKKEKERKIRQAHRIKIGGIVGSLVVICSTCTLQGPVPVVAALAFVALLFFIYLNPEEHL